MYCALRVPAIVLALGLALPVWAADDSKKDPKTDPKEKLLKGPEFTAKVIQVDGGQKTFTIEATVKVPSANSGALQSIANLQSQLANAVRIANPTERARKVQELQIKIAQEQQKAVQLKNETIKLELQAADDMKVRLANPPEEFDSKGKLKKYTPKELSDLKGPNKKLWGFTGDFDSIKADQTVKIFLRKNKPAPKPAPKDVSAKDKSNPKDPTPKDKDKDKDVEADKPLVLMVYILAEGKR